MYAKFRICTSWSTKKGTSDLCIQINERETRAGDLAGPSYLFISSVVSGPNNEQSSSAPIISATHPGE